MLIDEMIIVHWNNANKKHYEDLGYIFTNNNDELTIRVEDLPTGSHIKVKVKCDYCGSIIERSYSDYIRRHKHNQDACKKCKEIKTRNTVMIKYGARTTLSSKEVQDKRKATMVARYGVEHPLQSNQIKKKAQQTLISKYGVDNPAKSNQVQEKIEQTCLEKYGVRNVFQSLDVQAKAKKTLYNNYGVYVPMHSEIIKQRFSDSIMESHGCKISTQQLNIYNLLKDVYTECFLNYPCGSCFLDCCVKINDYNFDIEYDAPYWHQDEQRDRRRDEFVKSQGYKVLRIKSGHKTPSLECILAKINEMIDYDLKYSEIILDDYKY